MADIIERHMGGAFYRLAPLLRRAHSGRLKLVGKVDVRQGGVFAQLICKIFRFPPAGENVDLVVYCEQDAHNMHWKRSFNGHEMVSHFQESGRFLLEKLGPLRMKFIAEERSGALHYCFKHTALWFLPVPKILGPQIVAYEYEEEGRYHFNVEVRMFLVGPVLAYRGVCDLQAA